MRVVAVRCGAVQRVGGGGCAAKGRTEGCCLAAVWAGCCEEERDWQAQSLAGVKTLLVMGGWLVMVAVVVVDVDGGL